MFPGLIISCFLVRYCQVSCLDRVMFHGLNFHGWVLSCFLVRSCIFHGQVLSFFMVKFCHVSQSNPVMCSYSGHATFHGPIVSCSRSSGVSWSAPVIIQRQIASSFMVLVMFQDQVALFSGSMPAICHGLSCSCLLLSRIKPACYVCHGNFHSCVNDFCAVYPCHGSYLSCDLVSSCYVSRSLKFLSCVMISSASCLYAGVRSAKSVSLSYRPVAAAVCLIYT